MKTSTREFWKGIPSLVGAYIAIGAIVALGVAQHANAKAGIEVCEDVGSRLGAIHQVLSQAKSQADVQNLYEAVVAAEGIPDEQKEILVGGLQFLVTYANETGQLPARSQFVATGAQICYQQYGKPTKGSV